MKRFMIHPIIPLVIAFVLPPAGVGAGYGGLKHDLETYEPPPLVQSGMRPAPSAQEETKPATNASDGGDAAWKQEMTLLQEKWAEAATLPEPWEDRFISFSEDQMTPYRPAGDSAAEAGRIIGDRFSLTDLEILTLLRNPAIRAAERRFKAAVQEFSQVTQLDAILRQYSAFTEGLMTGVAPMKGKDPIRMKFPFPGVLGLKGQVVTKSVAIARTDLAIARRDAVTETRKAYWELLYDHQARPVTAETLSLFDRLEDVATTRYKSGSTSFQDVIKIRIHRKIIAENLVTLREKERNVEMRIRELLDLGPDAPVGRPKGQWPAVDPPTLESLYAQAVENRQELEKMRAMIGKMARMIEMGETMILPAYGQGLSLYSDEAIVQTGSAAMKETFPTATTAAMGAGLPKMPWYGTRDAYLQETRQKLQALKQDLEKAEAATRTMVRNAWFKLDDARRAAALYRNTIISLSKDALDVTNREYESGKVPFADAIGAYQDWLDVNLTLQRKRSDMGIAWAELARVVGVDL
jgi:outer membrane protein TolC